MLPLSSKNRTEDNRTITTAGIYKLVGNLSWWLGIVSLGFLTKLIKPSGIQMFGSVTAHSLVLFASVLFLCSLATSAMEAANRPETKTRS
jgi:hypothetical protein